MPTQSRGHGTLTTDHAPALDPPLPLPEEPDRLRIRLALGIENTGRESVRRVVVEDRNRSLQDDGAVVVLVVREVDRAAGDLRSVGQHRLVNVMAVIAVAAEGGDQR